MYPSASTVSSRFTLDASNAVSTVTAPMRARTIRATVKILRPIESRGPPRMASLRLMAVVPCSKATLAGVGCPGRLLDERRGAAAREDPPVRAPLATAGPQVTPDPPWGSCCRGLAWTGTQERRTACILVIERAQFFT